jgi:polysaccharide export outer membrane protein
MGKKYLLSSFLVMLHLTGCTIVPGMHMEQFSKQSSIEMPVE